MSKYLYETIVNRLVEESSTESYIENGKTVNITTPVKKVKPIKVAILQPDRKLFKGAELFYSKTLAYYLKEGLFPYSLVAKRYANDGGALTDAEIKRLTELKETLRSLEKEFFTTIASPLEGIDDKGVTQKKSDILFKINEINSEVSAIQNAYSDIFDNTAEMKSRNDTIEWWSLFLILIDEDEKGYKNLFKDGDYNSKVSVLEKFEDDNNTFYSEVIKRLSYLISFWFTAKTSLTKNDFETMEKLYKDSASNYNVEEPIVEIKKEEVAPIVVSS